MRPGISCSARRISLRPSSACERSRTLKSTPSIRPDFLVLGVPLVLVVIVVIGFLSWSLFSSGLTDSCSCGGGKQAGALAFGVAGEIGDARVLEARLGQEFGYRGRGEAEVGMAHGVPVFLAVVQIGRAHV